MLVFERKRYHNKIIIFVWIQINECNHASLQAKALP